MGLISYPRFTGDCDVPSRRFAVVDQPTVTTRLNIELARGKNNAVAALCRRNAAPVLTDEMPLQRCVCPYFLCIPKLFGCNGPHVNTLAYFFFLFSKSTIASEFVPCSRCNHKVLKYLYDRGVSSFLRLCAPASFAPTASVSPLPSIFVSRNFILHFGLRPRV